MNPKTRTFLWLLAGTGPVVFGAGMTLLGPQFVYGQDHALRPIPQFLAFYAAGWAGFAAAVWLAIRQQLPIGRPLFWIVGIGIIARLVALPSDLIQENDCYRYVLDGHAVASGVNPFRHPPETVARDAPEPLRSELQRDDAQRVLSRIGYPEISTIYPPAAQAAFSLGAAIVPWHWMGQRIVFLLADVATMLLIMVALRRFGLPVMNGVFYAWNPIIIKEVANSAHLDSLVGLFVMAILIAMRNWGERGGMAWLGVASLAFAGAVLTKLYPLVLFPVLAVYVLARGGMRSLFCFVGLSTATCALAYLPFLGVGLDRVAAGLLEYGTDWVRNDGAFGILEATMPYPRPTAGAIVAIGALAAGWRMLRVGSDPYALVTAIQATLLIWFLFTPAVFPWYAIGLLAVSTLRIRAWGVALSGLWCLYYMLFYFEYQEDLHAPGWVDRWSIRAQWLQHAPIWILLLADVCPWKKAEPRSRCRRL